MSLEKEMSRKKFDPPKIETLNKKTQVIYNWSGAYDMSDGSIHLGCEEKYTATIIWHEIMHMIFFEQFNLEANQLWDNIANELQEFLFHIKAPEEPYIYLSPPIKAKSIDDGYFVGRKQKEKSERVGWKPDTSKRVPIHVNRG